MTDPNLTPPIAKPKPVDVSAHVNEPVEALSASQAIAGLRASLSATNAQLENAIADRDHAAKEVKRLRGEVDGLQRILRASEPRTRKSK